MKKRAPTWRRALSLAAVAAFAAIALLFAAFPREAAAQATRQIDVTEIRVIDGHPVLFQYGRPVPAFEIAQPPGIHRRILSLDGEWAFTKDPAASSSWSRVEVPHVWDLEPGLETYDGPVWYQKRFHLPLLPDGDRVRLVFLGAADVATIDVNGKRAGFHRGAYMPFALDVTHLVEPGQENLLTVQLHRRSWGSTERSLLPPVDHDWWLYGGLFRSVYLEIVPEISIARVLAGQRSGVMKSVVVVHNEGEAERRLTVRFDPGWGDGRDLLKREATVAAGSTAAVSFELGVGPGQYWSPSNPRTYQATAEIIDAQTGERLDTLVEDYGLVDVTISGTRLMLGGKPLFIKGVNWHTDALDVGSAYTTAHFERDFDLMLEAGANLVRFSHYPRHPIAYRLTDEKGLLVIDEAPNYWMDRLSIAYQLEDGLSLSYVQSMVWNHMNHPSIVLWSIQNESETGVQGGMATRSFISQLAEAVRQLDLSGRPVTYASNHHRDDIGFGMVDVIGINEYFGFFYGKHQDLGPLLDHLHWRYPDKPVLITEFGDWALFGSSRQATQLLTFQAHWQQIIERSHFVTGGIWWVFADHKSRHQPESVIPFISTMGMVDRQRRPKRLFDVFKEAPFPRDDEEHRKGG